MSEARLTARLSALLGGRVSFGVPLSRLTTLGVGGPALALARPETAEEVAAVLAAAGEEGRPCLALGAGSNLLFPDAGFPGVLIKPGPALEKFEISAEGLARAGAGARAAGLIAGAVAAGFGGLECLSGIPCTLGGALVMNAGSGGGSVGELVSRVMYVDGLGRPGEMGRDELAFEYRRSGGLPEGAIVLGAELRLTRVPAGILAGRLAELAAKRRAGQPQGARSAGCFFKNPPNDSAGRLIDQCGLKGARVGGARVSEVHANFIVNAGGATAADILALAELIRDRVARQYGIRLEPEVKIIKG